MATVGRDTLISPRNAWRLGRLLYGQDLNGELDSIPGDFRPIADYLTSRPVEDRLAAWSCFLFGRGDRDTIIKVMASVDPLGPPPVEDTRRPATLADLRRLLSDVRWAWDAWIPSSRIFGVAAFEGMGKTRFALDLSRRIYHREGWPDGQQPTFPEGTPTLWVCADGNQDDVAEAVMSFDLPDEALFLNTMPEDPYGGTDLDDPGTLAALEENISAVRPGLTFIDTLTNSTRRDLCRQSEVATVMGPLKEIAQRQQTSIGVMLHLSRDGQALGRRIKGVTRSLIHLDCPDPDHPERLKLWVEKSFAKKPPALGVTMNDGGNDYDFNPPSAPAADKGGRPAESRDKAKQFVKDALTRENDRIGSHLRDEWEKSGGNSRTFWRAVDDLQATGDLSTEGGRGSGKQKILHLNNLRDDCDDDPAVF
jgi:hypothetical protein